jgi:two-component system phosphate regulon response regulator PhoB
VVVLDWMLPGESGLSLARRLRGDARTRELPIVMLTARAMESDKISGLEAGADDYLTKPFSPRELLARVSAVLRRVRPVLAGKTIEAGDIKLDPVAHRVERAGHPMQLGPTEYRLLQFFMEHPRQVFSRGQLLDAVWGNDKDIELRTVDVHIRRLRKAINPAGQADPIRTVRSAGYAFELS